ncbi:unnamed protein product [Allacma fusca]|uniref:G-protein coupled receptors family 1 profile domain-containing protein n=1 Tax=Allacma fusca TaxID=39272 RepID=A0A8J2PTN4_9HEXA|nr:unnamed protein product [Allacma fusca]
MSGHLIEPNASAPLLVPLGDHDINETELSVGEGESEGMSLLEMFEEDKTFEFIVVGVGISVIAILGIIGNILTMMVLSRPQMKSSVCCLLFNLACCDLILLIVVLPVHGINVFIKHFSLWPEYTSLFIPRAAPFLLPIIATAQTGSIYFTMSVSAERYIAVCWPLKSRFLCTWSRARYYSLAVFIFSCLINVPRWFELQTYETILRRMNPDDGFYELETQYEVGYTALRSNSMYTKYYMYPMLLVFQHILPFIVLAVFNTAIYLTIKKANEKRQGLTSVQTREISYAVMLVFVVIVFLCCNVLGMFLLLWESQNVEFSTRYILLANFLLTFNSSINFLIYCAFGSNFRQQFVSMYADYSFVSIQCKKTEEVYFSSL